MNHRLHMAVPNRTDPRRALIYVNRAALDCFKARPSSFTNLPFMDPVQPHDTEPRKAVP
jgi:hypothetical protein